MSDTRTIGERFQADEVTAEQVTTGVSAYPNGPTLGVHEIAKGASVDIAAAVLASRYAQEILALADAIEGRRRNAARTPTLLAPAG